MKRDEDFGPDRGIDFETDDEENQAETVCEDNDETESDVTDPSPSASMHQNVDNTTWPQSYRLSMDMYTGTTPPNISFLTGSFLTSAHKRSQAAAHSSLTEDSFQSPTEPLISTEISLDKDEFPTSYSPAGKSSATNAQLSRFSWCLSAPTTQQCSYAQSLLNAINVLCGIGLLSTPYALKQGGWWSLTILFIFGIITCFTGILLKRCLESSPLLQTYPDIGQAAFGIPGRIFLSIFLYMELYSSCVEYLIMMSDNLSSLFPNANLNFSGVHLDSYQLCTIISTLIILPTVWLRNLSLLSVISVGGVVTAVVVSLCLLWVGVVDQVGFHPNGPAFNLSKLPVTIGLFSFCYGSHSVFPNIYSSMKEPSEFPSVLIISFGTSCLLYAAVGICGFLMFGDSTKSQFTLNMPSGFVVSKVAAWTTVVAPVTKYALTITPVAFSLEELLPSALGRSYSISILVRTILVFSTLVVALTVPYFGSVMAFIGSSLVMLIALIFPCACYLRICRDRLTKLQIWACIFIMNVGLVCAIVGTYSAITTLGDEGD